MSKDINTEVREWATSYHNNTGYYMYSIVGETWVGMFWSWVDEMASGYDHIINLETGEVVK